MNLRTDPRIPWPLCGASGLPCPWESTLIHNSPKLWHHEAGRRRYFLHGSFWGLMVSAMATEGDHPGFHLG